ncbi:MAG: hypothetical protein HY975_02560 [Candidatus Kerfeldbacteria bacterium]|nr:hypothetical protein [Candidatus Kerfeldbacteria bacterium]
MRLSALQRFIIRECYQYPKPRVPRSPFEKYYAKRSSTATDNITASLERLVDRGLLIGYGRRTPRKWFIEEVRLTSLGRRTVRLTFGQQQRLPLT